MANLRLRALAELGSQHSTRDRLVSPPDPGAASIPHTNPHRLPTAKRQSDRDQLLAVPPPPGETVGTESPRSCLESPKRWKWASADTRTCMHERTSRIAAPALASSLPPDPPREHMPHPRSAIADSPVTVTTRQCRFCNSLTCAPLPSAVMLSINRMPALSTTSRTRTRRPLQGCHGYRIVQVPVLWAVSRSVVQRRAPAQQPGIPAAGSGDDRHAKLAARLCWPPRLAGKPAMH